MADEARPKGFGLCLASLAVCGVRKDLMALRHDTKHRLGDNDAPLHGQVITALREAILTRRLKPGERLIEGKLADEMGVSRNPIREAIRALASEGLIEVTARRGASVIAISDQAARETIEIRALLEGHNARLAARRQDTETIKRIKAVLKRGEAAVSSRRFDQLLALNQEFHQELSTAGHNTVLGEMLKRLRERTALLFSPADPMRQALSWQEHAAILEAIVRGDERSAAALASQHVIRAGTDFLTELVTAEVSSLPVEKAVGHRKGGRRGALK
jgi:DNA-binding GntR family transcriptional regulator